MSESPRVIGSELLYYIIGARHIQQYSISSNVLFLLHSMKQVNKQVISDS